MAQLYLELLLPRTKKGDLLHLLCAVGGIKGDQVGRIELHGAVAVVEVPSGWEMRLARALDASASVVAARKRPGRRRSGVK